MDMKKYMKDYRKKNREKISLYIKDYRSKNKEVINKVRKEWVKNNPDKIVGYKKENQYIKLHRIHAKNYRLKHPLIINIYNQTNYYINIPEGKLCDLCNKNLAEEKHHADYSKPLEVQILCIPCHKKIHLEGGDKVVRT